MCESLSSRRKQRGKSVVRLATLSVALSFSATKARICDSRASCHRARFGRGYQCVVVVTSSATLEGRVQEKVKTIAVYLQLGYFNEGAFSLTPSLSLSPLSLSLLHVREFQGNEAGCIIRVHSRHAAPRFPNARASIAISINSWELATRRRGRASPKSAASRWRLC